MKGSETSVVLRPRSAFLRLQILIHASSQQGSHNSLVTISSRFVKWPRRDDGDVVDDVAIRVEGNASQGRIAMRDLAPHVARRRLS